MNQVEKLQKLANEVQIELNNSILSYWTNNMQDSINGGFLGRRNGNDQVVVHADKGCILNARILWSFSAAYRITKDKEHLDMAHRAYEYLNENFFDPEFKGAYWSLDYLGRMKDGKKQIYAQAFVIYALSEYYMITKKEDALNRAIELFQLIEKYSFDNVKGGYFEAMSKEWKEIDDLRLSDKDANEKKTMNTHLHVLEAYTNLYRIWKNDRLKNQLQNLIKNFLDYIVNKESYHLDLFFDENWVCKSTIISYGHDIEASWLLDEAARELGDKELLDKTQKVCLKIATAATEGLKENTGMIYEFEPTNNHLEADRHWWVQAEAIVGYINAWELTREEDYLDKALSVWDFVKNNIVDRKNGEWHWSVNEKQEVNLNDDKAGFWKCPYHNARMCIEVINRTSASNPIFMDRL